ncbi:PDDEXK nuclease domain-containing protein [Burkholderia cepacia]|uniref:PDDEXK nuclease domain-containing protein n=1 Tax=Burkholderia cepacia TaxID=292 RepID=UPI001E532D06|nr:PDDEXK nuclease domain-containing protein [Burkholderia cepacia]
MPVTWPLLARARAAAAVNAELTLLYWQVGCRIRDDVLGGERAGYGQQILPALARQLRAEYGRGWSEQQLRHCIRAAEVFPDEPILSALRRELSWTHLKMLMYVDDPLKRDFYIELCRLERWSSRQLQERMQSMLFERSALSRQPDEVIRREVAHLRDAQQVTSDLVLKDLYILDFLGLNDHYLERDLEDAILREMEQFLLELGAGFTFVARQKRLPIDDDDFYLDLLFYNRLHVTTRMSQVRKKSIAVRLDLYLHIRAAINDSPTSTHQRVEFPRPKRVLSHRQAQQMGRASHRDVM